MTWEDSSERGARESLSDADFDKLKVAIAEAEERASRAMKEAEFVAAAESYKKNLTRLVCAFITNGDYSPTSALYEAEKTLGQISDHVSAKHQELLNRAGLNADAELMVDPSESGVVIRTSWGANEQVEGVVTGILKRAQDEIQRVMQAEFNEPRSVKLTCQMYGD